MLLTFRFWYTLKQRPAAGTQFVGTLRMISTRQGNKIIITQQPAKKRRVRSLPLMGCLAAIVVALISPGIFFAAFLGVFLLPFLSPLLLFISHNLDGARWATAISGAIAREHRNSTYDLLALARDGHWGLAWHICNGYLHYNDRLDRHYRRTGFFILAVVLLSALGALALHPVTLLVGAAYIVMIYLDRLQSTIIAILLGIWLPAMTQNPREARLMAFGSFLLVQVATYVLTWVILILSLQLGRDLPDGIGIFFAALITVAMFYLIRELVIMGLWRILQQRLAVADETFELTLGFDL